MFFQLNKMIVQQLALSKMIILSNDDESFFELCWKQILKELARNVVDKDGEEYYQRNKCFNFLDINDRMGKEKQFKVTEFLQLKTKHHEEHKRPVPFSC